MKKENIKVDSGTIESTFYTKDDIKKVVEMYKKWIDINAASKDLEARIINTPEAISEIIASYYYKLGRTNNSKTTGKIDGKSMDAVSRGGKKVQIKGSAVKGGTLTSFSPKSNYDEIILMDFYVEGKWDGTIDMYIAKPFPKGVMVNKNETFGEFQAKGKRPRFNLYSKFKDGTIPYEKIDRININDFLKK